MKLIATPRSHFARKVRLLLDHLSLSYDFLDIGKVTSTDLETFHGNPAMGVPVLEDGDVWMLESDHIANYLVRTYDPEDRYSVLNSSVDYLNMRAIMNNVMDNEVKYILSARTGLDPAPHAYFQKARLAIERGLFWLEERSEMFQALRPGYLEFHFISMWEHLALFGPVEMAYPKLSKLAERLSSQEKIALSHPG